MSERESDPAGGHDASSSQRERDSAPGIRRGDRNPFFERRSHGYSRSGRGCGRAPSAVARIRQFFVRHRGGIFRRRRRDQGDRVDASRAVSHRRQAALGDQVAVEMLQSQIEVATLPHVDMATARAELKYLRQTAGAGRRASTAWRSLRPARIRPPTGGMSRSSRQASATTQSCTTCSSVGQRNMLCGLHVHVELPDGEDRVDVMYRMLPYLPLFIALSTSSPFWQSQPHRAEGLSACRLR